MYEWSLKDLYLSYDDPAFQADLNKLDSLLVSFQQANYEDSISGLTQLVKLLEEKEVLLQRLYAFVQLNLTTNTSDEKSNNVSAVLANKVALFAKAETQIKRFLGASQTDISQDTYLSQYQFFFSELRAWNAHLQSDEVEAVLHKADLTGGSAWSDLMGYLTSAVEGEFDGKPITLSEVRNLAYSDDADVRRKAYETELTMYDTIKQPIAFALNHIKAQVNEEARLRGFDSALSLTLFKSRMAQETLDALLGAIKAYLPHFRRYLRHKGKLLGHDNGLPFYELFAPVGKSTTTFSVESSKDYLVKHFAGFSADLAEMTATFYDKSYMDFFPRKGKVGGAFCWNLPIVKQSRVLLNFDGSLSDIVTIAHELGHAYHGLHVENHLPLNWEYSMPVAETASTFNENIIMNALLKESTDRDEQVALIESQLQNMTQIIVDIYSRYLFEQSVFAARDTSFMFAPQLEEMMLAAQEAAYGDGLDPDVRHPFMWACKGHYYSSGLSYYNFPYAFGGLFANGLYALYQEQPDTFVANYQALLRATTVSSVEDTAAVVGVDVRSQAFWESALERVKEMIDLFITLTTTE